MVVLPITMLETGDPLRGLLTIVGATVVISLIALCVTQFTRRQAAAGGLHSFAFQGLGTRAALTTGVAILVKFLGSATLTLYSGGRALTAVLAQLGVDATGPAGRIAVYARGRRGGAGRAGARRAGRGRRDPRGRDVLAAVHRRAVGAALGRHRGPPAGAGGTAHGVLYLALAAIFSLAGFESATFFGPEAKRPLVTITRTVLLTPMICGALFVLAAWAAWTGRSATLINTYLYGTDSGAPALLVIVLEVGICCSWLASATASSHAASRLVYSMGVERLLPRGFTTVHPRFRTPYPALVVIVVLATIERRVRAGRRRARARRRGVLRHIVRAMVVAAYVLVAVASIRFLLRIREQTPGVLVGGLVASAAGIALLGYLLVATVLDGDLAAPLLIVALLVAGSWNGSATCGDGDPRGSAPSARSTPPSRPTSCREQVRSPRTLPATSYSSAGARPLAPAGS